MTFKKCGIVPQNFWFKSWNLIYRAYANICQEETKLYMFAKSKSQQTEMSPNRPPTEISLTVARTIFRYHRISVSDYPELRRIFRTASDREQSEIDNLCNFAPLEKFPKPSDRDSRKKRVCTKGWCLTPFTSR